VLTQKDLVTEAATPAVAAALSASRRTVVHRQPERPAGSGAAGQGSAFTFEITSQYSWLFIPFLSWVGLVFPLILPPIPLGPIMVSLSWNRREWMSHIRRAMSHVGRKRKEHEFPMGWIVNVGVNLMDMATLGLSHLFITAELLSAMIKEDGTKEERAEIDPVMWVLKWLVLGNVVFVGAYVLCPGLIFKPLLTQLENHLFLQYKIPRGTVKAKTDADVSVEFGALMTARDLAELGNTTPVLLWAESVPVEKEPDALELFRKVLGYLAVPLTANGIAVRWCNLDQSSPSRYAGIAKHLASLKLAERGWTFLQGGKAVRHRSLAPLDVAVEPEHLANVGRQTISLPLAAVIPRNRLSSPDVLVSSLQEALQKNETATGILIVFTASQEQESKTVLDIRNDLLPKVRASLDAAGALVCLANGDKKVNPGLREELNAVQKNFKGAILFRNGKVESHKKLGALSSWDDYAKQIEQWLGKPKTPITGSVEAEYYVAERTDEAIALSHECPVLLLAGVDTDSGGGFVKEVLPEIWRPAEEAGFLICWQADSGDGGGGPPSHGQAGHRVALIHEGQIITEKQVPRGIGSAVHLAAAVEHMLGSIAWE